MNRYEPVCTSNRHPEVGWYTHILAMPARFVPAFYRQFKNSGRDRQPCYPLLEEVCDWIQYMQSEEEPDPRICVDQPPPVRDHNEAIIASLRVYCSNDD